MDKGSVKPKKKPKQGALARLGLSGGSKRSGFKLIKKMTRRPATVYGATPGKEARKAKDAAARSCRQANVEREKIIRLRKSAQYYKSIRGY